MPSIRDSKLDIGSCSKFNILNYNFYINITLIGAQTEHLSLTTEY